MTRFELLRVTLRRTGTPLSINQKIFRAAALIGLCTVVAKLASTAKELSVAQWFGRTDSLDAFLIAFLLPSFVVGIVAGSINNALIPVFIDVREKLGQETAQRLFSSVSVLTVATLIGASVLIALLAPYYLPLLGSGFSPAKLILTRRILYLLLPFVVLSGAVSVWSAVLNAAEQFILPALTPAITAVAIIALLFLGANKWGVFSLAAGTVVGQLGEAAWLAKALKMSGMRIRPSWAGADLHVRRVVVQCVPLAAGAFISGGTILVDQSMATMLAPGSVAALSYANRVTGVILGIGTMALGRAVLPYFSGLVAREDWTGFRHTMRTYSRLTAGVTFPIMILLFLFAKPVVRMLFERGAFTSADTAVVGPVLAFYSIQIPFYALGILSVNVLSSVKRNDVLFYVAGLNIVLDVILNLVLMKTMGVAGIALSSSLVSFVSLLFVGIFVLRMMKSGEQAALRIPNRHQELVVDRMGAINSESEK